MNEQMDVLFGAYIGIQDGKILSISKTPPEEQPSTIIDGTGMVAIPGLINCHTHLATTVLRNLTDDENRRQALEAWLLQNLAAEAIDVIILAGFMFILSPAFIEAYRDRIINVHPALIPSFCGEGFYGLHVHEAALGYGVKVTGATVHLVNEIPDGGRILLQKAVDILPGDTPEVLQKRVMEQAEWILLPQAAELLCHELGKQA